MKVPHRGQNVDESLRLNSEEDWKVVYSHLIQWNSPGLNSEEDWKKSDGGITGGGAAA